jgi:hypothetical protein
MWGACNNVKLARHSGSTQSVRVCLAFVVKKFDVPNTNPGLGKPSEIFASRWSGIFRYVISSKSLSQIRLPPSNVQRVAPDEVIRFVQGPIESSSVIEHWAKQPLSNGLDAAFVVDSKHQTSCKTAAGTLATNRESRDIDT